MHESEGGQNETSATNVGRMHSRQQGQSGDSDRLVMTSLILDWPAWWAAGQTYPSSLEPKTVALGPKQT